MSTNIIFSFIILIFLQEYYLPSDDYGSWEFLVKTFEDNGVESKTVVFSFTQAQGQGDLVLVKGLAMDACYEVGKFYIVYLCGW